MLDQKTKQLLIELQDEIYTFYDDAEYKLLNLNYFEPTHTAKIEFQKLENYRTIVRYVQRDYQRYPVYSNWKVKTSKIKKSLKINSETLENLKNNLDFFLP